MWTARLVLESMQHQANFFLTLTYDEEHYPADGSVCVREAQLFLKRLRQLASPERLRYFIVGEYGEQTWRAHYHAVIFGLSVPGYVAQAWQKGFSYVQPFSVGGAQYLAGYVGKKLTRKGDSRLGGRAPEFARMSLRPGIGYGALAEIHDKRSTEVPSVFRLDGKLWPIGRYLRSGLRSFTGEVGHDSGYSERLRVRRDELSMPGARVALEEQRAGQIAGYEAREKIFRSGRKL